MTAPQKNLKRPRPKHAQPKHTGLFNGAPSEMHFDKKRKHNTRAPSTFVEAHHCWFVQWEISSITALAGSPKGDILAAARKSGCIELRRKHMRWATSFTIHWNASDETETVSAMLFDSSGSLLFVGRFNGLLEIYSVSDEGMLHCVSLEPGGGAIMSLCMHPWGKFEIAVGCEDGCVRFISVDDQFVELNTRPSPHKLPVDPSHYSVVRGNKLDGMCLSLSWKLFGASEDSILACGDSNGGLRWISGTSKKILGRGCIPPLENKSCRIWTVQVVAGGRQVVCGDSRGMISVWCSRTFTKVEENQIDGMAGDVWTSVVSDADANDTEKVFFGCAGGSIGSYTSLISSDGSISWAASRGHTVHSHDVKYLASLGASGYASASNDTRLCVFDEWKCDTKQLRSKFVYPYHGSVNQNPHQYVIEQDLFVARHSDRIDCWQLPSSQKGKPVLALRLKVPGEQGRIRACAVSYDAAHIAISCDEKFSLYKALPRKSKGNVKALFGNVTRAELSPKAEKMFQGAQDVLFMDSRLVAITRGRQQILTLVKGVFRVIQKSSVGTSAHFLTHIASCRANEQVAVSDSRGGIFTSSMTEILRSRAKQGMFQARACFGSEKSVSCLRFSRNGRTLVAALCDFTVAVISLESEAYICMTRPYPSLPTSIGFLFNDSFIVVSGRGFSYLTSLSEMRTDGGNLKLKKSVECIARGDAVLTSLPMSSSRVFVIQRKWETEFAHLPRVLPKKLYGL